VTDEDKEGIISRVIRTPAGKKALADAMQRPVKRCPVCANPYEDLMSHCDSKGDPEHLAASVMET
jgi:hypothetical protein